MRFQEITTGDRAEYNCQKSLCPHNGEPCEVLAVGAGRVLVRFADGHEMAILPGHLSWLPSVADYEAAKAAVWQEHLRKRKEELGPNGATEGRPHQWYCDRRSDDGDED